MVVLYTYYYIKHFRTGTDGYNGVLMSLQLLVAEINNSYLKVKCEERILISPLTLNKVELSVERSISDHLLFCNRFPFFNDFIILAYGTNKFLLDDKESL